MTNALERPLSPDRAETSRNSQPNHSLRVYRPTQYPIRRDTPSSSLGAGASAGCLFPQTLWAEDTRSLPRALASYRRQVREFAEQQLRPLAEQLDLQPHSRWGSPIPSWDNLLVLAGQQGYLSDLLPAPFGSTPWLRYRCPLAWQPAIRKEFARVCGGLMLLLECPQSGSCPLFAQRETCGQTFSFAGIQRNQAGNPHLFA